MRGSDLDSGQAGSPGGAAFPTVLDGFWMPRSLRGRFLSGHRWETVWLRGGAFVSPGSPAAVPVRWPRLGANDMEWILSALSEARSVPAREAVARWESALVAVMPGLLDRASEALPLLATCTGYSVPMLREALGAEDLVDPGGLARALEYRPSWGAAAHWETMPGMAGKARFFPTRPHDRLRGVGGVGGRLFRPAQPIELALGFAAGNVPGTAFVMTLLAGLANHLAESAASAPAVLVRNSRYEPVFASWVLSAVEAIDPELVSATAVLVWDYEDRELQGTLMRQAGLMLAAAGDDTIAALDRARTAYAPSLRFHRHGHKASFAVVDGETMGGGGLSPVEVARPAALDSAMWDQNGCLSARVHFVHGDPLPYAAALANELRSLSGSLPRGAAPRRFTHRAFDRYKELEGSRRVRMLSGYDDDFVVALDARPWDEASLGRAVNACQGRVVVVRPVDDLAAIPALLQTLPASNLQSVSVAMDGRRVESLADLMGACGVTAIRSLGRAAFPRLAYSWDGFLPPDLCAERPPGHFTTIEFDDPRREIEEALARSLPL